MMKVIIITILCILIIFGGLFLAKQSCAWYNDCAGGRCYSQYGCSYGCACIRVDEYARYGICMKEYY